jgi:hypothetical protein
MCRMDSGSVDYDQGGALLLLKRLTPQEEKAFFLPSLSGTELPSMLLPQGCDASTTSQGYFER